MSRLRAKLAPFTDSRSYCCGTLLDVLADRHNKHSRSLHVDSFVAGAGQIMIIVHGIGEANSHIRAVVVLDMLPRAEIVGGLNSEPNSAVLKFVEKLARGIVSELVGCLVLELHSDVVYVKVVETPLHQESRGEQSVQGEHTVLVLVDAFGCGNCFRWDAERPFSRTHHKWEHIATLDFAQQCIVVPGSTVRVEFFDYNAETGEVVFSTTSETAADPSASTQEVHICSLRFKSKNVIEQSRIMTVGSFNHVVNVLCSSRGFWIVCADLQVAYYRYDMCRMYALDLRAEISTLDPAFEVDSVLAAISTDPSAQHSSLSVCVQHTLLIVNWHDGDLQLRGAHRLDRALHHKGSPSVQDIVLQDLYIAVEQTSPQGTSAVVCLASAAAVYVLHIVYPSLSALRTEHVTIQNARLCVTLLMPKSRSKRVPIVPEKVQFIDPISSGNALLYVRKGSTVYTITAAGASERSTRSKNRGETSDLESVVSDVDDIRQRFEQVNNISLKMYTMSDLPLINCTPTYTQFWLALFPASTRGASAMESYLFREGDAEVPITSIHQHTLLREYLHRARSGSGGDSDTHESHSRPSSESGLQPAPFAYLSSAVKSLLAQVAEGGVSLHRLLCGSETSVTTDIPFTVQTVVDVLEQLAASAGNPASQSRGSRGVSTTQMLATDVEPGPPSAVTTTVPAALAAPWIADLDLATLLPAPQRSHNARLYEFGRCVDSLLVMDLVHTLSPQLSSAEEEGTSEGAALHSRSSLLSAALFYSSSNVKIVELFAPGGDTASPSLLPAVFVGDLSAAQARALSLDVVLHLLLGTRPAHFLDVLFCLLEIEQRSLHRLGGAAEGPESPVPSLLQKRDPAVEEKTLPKIRSFRTSIGSAGEGVPQQVVKEHVHHAHQHNQRQARSHHKLPVDHAVDEDDDLFGLGLSAAVRQAQAQARAPVPVDISVHLHRNRLLGTRNVSTTVFESEGDGSSSESQSDSASDISDGEDAFGIFRDVEEDSEPRSQPHANRATNDLSPPTRNSLEVWQVRELLRRATQPLMPSEHNGTGGAGEERGAGGARGEGGANSTATSCSTPLRYVSLLERCEAAARSVLDTITTRGVLGSAVENKQVDCLLQVLLICHQPVQAAQYMIKLGQFASLVAFCQRLAASVTLLAADSEDATPSHPVARYVQAIGGARTSARFSAKQNQSGSARWEALLAELYAVSENNLPDTLSAVVSQPGTAGVAPTAAQIRLVEYIVALKLTLRCLLARPEGFKEVVSAVLELVQGRPAAVPLEAMRAWVNAYAVNGADKSRILLSGILGNH